MSQFLDVIIFGSNYDLMKQLIEDLKYEQGKLTKLWYNDGVQIRSVRLEKFPDVICRFLLVEDMDQIEGIDDLAETSAAILLLDATEDDVRDKTEKRVKQLREAGTVEFIVPIVNAAPRKNDQGILSRRQAKYFITGMDNEYKVNLQYFEISEIISEEDSEALWNFVETTIDDYLS